MNQNDFGPMLLNILFVTLPSIFCGTLFLCSILCGLGTIKHAIKIGNANNPDAFKRSWMLWIVGLIVLAVFAFSTQLDCVNGVINTHLESSTKVIAAQICAIACIAPLSVIVLRSGVAILKRLSH